MNLIEAYPLAWPMGTPRHQFHKRSKFRVRTIAEARDFLMNEVKLLKGTDLVISSNLRLQKDGLPLSKQAQPKDNGVAVYFKWKGASRSIACDQWDTVADNIYALGLSIEAMRGLDRWGATDILQRAFQGFTALPAPKGSQWWEVLAVERDTHIEGIELRYRRLARSEHPDTGGSMERMSELNRAIEEARQEKRQQ